MSGPTLVIFVGGLVAVFLVIVAALMWQEAKARGMSQGPVYILEDAVDFVTDRLDQRVAADLARTDVRRILEWEIYYLQGLAQKDRKAAVETFAGGTDDVVEYLQGQIAEKHNVTYDQSHIRTVLAFEAEYLVVIGAVGEPVDEEEEADHP